IQPCLMFRYSSTVSIENYTLSLHDALPIWIEGQLVLLDVDASGFSRLKRRLLDQEPGQSLHSGAADRIVGGHAGNDIGDAGLLRSEEHTSELQSRENLVCRLLLEKKKTSMK